MVIQMYTKSKAPAEAVALGMMDRIFVVGVTANHSRAVNTPTEIVLFLDCLGNQRELSKQPTQMSPSRPSNAYEGWPRMVHHDEPLMITTMDLLGVVVSIMANHD